MIKLTNTLRDWQTDSFERALKEELTNLTPGTLPLHLATTQGGVVDDRDIAITVFGATDDDHTITSG